MPAVPQQKRRSQPVRRWRVKIGDLYFAFPALVCAVVIEWLDIPHVGITLLGRRQASRVISYCCLARERRERTPPTFMFCCLARGRRERTPLLEGTVRELVFWLKRAPGGLDALFEQQDVRKGAYTTRGGGDGSGYFFYCLKIDITGDATFR